MIRLRERERERIMKSSTVMRIYVVIVSCLLICLQSTSCGDLHLVYLCASEGYQATSQT